MLFECKPMEKVRKHTGIERLMSKWNTNNEEELYTLYWTDVKDNKELLSRIEIAKETKNIYMETVFKILETEDMDWNWNQETNNHR